MPAVTVKWAAGRVGELRPEDIHGRMTENHEAVITHEWSTSREEKKATSAAPPDLEDGKGEEPAKEPESRCGGRSKEQTVGCQRHR